MATAVPSKPARRTSQRPPAPPPRRFQTAADIALETVTVSGGGDLESTGVAAATAADDGSDASALPNSSQRAKRRGKKALPQQSPQCDATSARVPVSRKVLMYIDHHRDRPSHDALKKCVLAYFMPVGIYDASKWLVLEFADQLDGCMASIDQRTSGSR